MERTDFVRSVCSLWAPESAKRSLVVVVKWNELIMITGRESCSRVQSVEGQPSALKLGKAKVRAVASRELGSASLRKMGAASLSEKVKPALEGKRRPRAPFKLPGVIGDSAHRNNHQELGRPCLSSGLRAGELSTGSHNRRGIRTRESEGPIVARIRRLSRRGVKGPWPKSSRVRRTRS
jgi:hypothetical protein